MVVDAGLMTTSGAGRERPCGQPSDASTSSFRNGTQAERRRRLAAGAVAEISRNPFRRHPSGGRLPRESGERENIAATNRRPSNLPSSFSRDRVGRSIGRPTCGTAPPDEFHERFRSVKIFVPRRDEGVFVVRHDRPVAKEAAPSSNRGATMRPRENSRSRSGRKTSFTAPA